MSASAIAATISQGSARHKGSSGAGGLSGLAAGQEPGLILSGLAGRDGRLARRN
jgi:hypothetical protein